MSKLMGIQELFGIQIYGDCQLCMTFCFHEARGKNL